MLQLYINDELADMAGLPADISRTTLLSLIAAREALNDAAIPDWYCHL